VEVEETYNFGPKYPPYIVHKEARKEDRSGPERVELQQAKRSVREAKAKDVRKERGFRSSRERVESGRDTSKWEEYEGWRTKGE
jgi:hypothetical protein